MCVGGFGVPMIDCGFGISSGFASVFGVFSGVIGLYWVYLGFFGCVWVVCSALLRVLGFGFGILGCLAFMLVWGEFVVLWFLDVFLLVVFDVSLVVGVVNLLRF